MASAVMDSCWVARRQLFLFYLFIYLFFYFPTVQQGDQVILTCIHFPPPFVLLQHEYLDKVLNATQQDLLVNLF